MDRSSSSPPSPTISNDSRTRCQISSRGTLRFFAAEGRVIAQSFKNDLRVRVLKHQSHATSRLARIDAIDGERALLLAFLIAAKYACETGHHRAFARARSTEQQHTFTWPDGEIDGTQREVLTRGVPPSPAAGLYRSRINLHQTRALLRPDSKRSRAPVTASARDKYQTTTPAITTPEMMEPTRYQVTRRPFQPGLVAQ